MLDIELTDSDLNILGGLDLETGLWPHQIIGTVHTLLRCAYHAASQITVRCDELDIAVDDGMDHFRGRAGCQINLAVERVQDTVTLGVSLCDVEGVDCCDLFDVPDLLYPAEGEADLDADVDLLHRFCDSPASQVTVSECLQRIDACLRLIDALAARMAIPVDELDALAVPVEHLELATFGAEVRRCAEMAGMFASRLRAATAKWPLLT